MIKDRSVDISVTFSMNPARCVVIFRRIIEKSVAVIIAIFFAISESSATVVLRFAFWVRGLFDVR